MNVKNNIIDQLDNQKGTVSATINGKPGGEGYVLQHPAGDIKLVNRSGFSAANRAVERQEQTNENKRNDRRHQGKRN